MKRWMIALASATALLAAPAMAQDKIKIGAAPYGLNAEFDADAGSPRCRTIPPSRAARSN